MSVDSLKKLHIAIYGAGAMGTVLGSLLTLGGVSVDLITRNKAHAQALKEQGATIVCEAENKELQVKVNALLPEEMRKKYDVVFLMTKQRENKAILQFLRPHLADDFVLCTTQNGLPELSISEIVDTKHIYGAATSFGATFLGEGKVSLTSKFDGMTMDVGGYQNDGAKTALLIEILSAAGAAVGKEDFARSSDNLIGARWSKLAINAAFSGLSVVTGLTFGKIAKRSKSRKIALGILRECMDVAEAAGVRMEKMQGHDMRKLLGGKSLFRRMFAYTVLPFAMRKHKKLVSGMLKDVQNGKKCEIDFINGAVCKEGARVGVETPLCDKVVELTKGIENGLYELCYNNVVFF